MTSINTLKIVLIEEDSPSNFGHNELIWDGNIKFPKEIEYFDKQNEIDRALKNNELKPIKNQKDIFELKRYSINKLNKPNDNNGPTLSISLFMPNSKLYNLDSDGKSNFSSWTNKYFQNQLMLCIAFNIYFPNGNYRNYFDYYMLEKFRSLSGDDDCLKVTKQILHFDYIDLEDDNKSIENQGIVNKILVQFYDELKKYEDYPFKNGLDRFIHTFDLACRTYNNYSNLEFREKTGDFFVYKFNGPFIENKGLPNEGHITDGYIGQIIRYISLKQNNYGWNEDTIKKPIHLVWRDAHTNCIAHNDHLWINELNKYANENKEIYFLPNSPDYTMPWHDTIKCPSDNLYYKRSAIAGIVQIINSELCNNDELYLKTLGLAFIINNDTIPLSIYREKVFHYRGGRQTYKYDYGIDEYVLTSFFKNEYIKKKLIIFNKHMWNFFIKDGVHYNYYYYYINIATIFILKYLLNNNKIKHITKIPLIYKAIDELRNDEKLGTDIGFLLSFIPNKYQLDFYIFNSYAYLQLLMMDTDIDEYIQYYTDIYLEGNLSKIDRFNYITKENFKSFGLNCKNNAVNMIMMDWCQKPYTTRDYYSLYDCSSANFFSGYYNEIPPSLDIGILRQPSDFKYVIDAMEKNKLKIRLNKSDYKLNVENDKLRTSVHNVLSDGFIDVRVQLIIFKYGDIINDSKTTEAEDIAQKATELNPKDDFILSRLIWKALNYSNYDVPPEWFSIKLYKNEDYIKFNDLVKKLSNINGWAEYAINVLSNDNKDLVLSQIKEKSDYYKSISHNYNNLKMSMYESKYRKYKEKYLALKKELELR